MAISFDLTGKRALVTGANTGPGRMWRWQGALNRPRRWR
jgi:hypothetical protein